MKTVRELQYSGDIIFLTNFQEYVFDGYSVRAFNYLLKPITLEVLTPCMDAYLQLHSDDYYYYQNDQTYIRIPYTNIISISKEKNNTLIVTTDNIYIERISLDEIMNKLSSNFVRCHKSCIVNILHVQSLIKNNLHLSNNTWQSVGRSYLPSVRAHMSRFMQK